MSGSDAIGKDSMAGLFAVLKQIRTRAGLTQRQIAQATGAGGKHGHKLIARLEAGRVPNPSVRLVLNYLRACRATSSDLAGFLDGFLGEPLAIPSRARRGPGPKQPVPEPETQDPTMLALRKEAAWWKLRRALEEILHEELNRLGAKPMSAERNTAAGYGVKVFRSLYKSRNSRPASRERRLERSRAWAERNGLPNEIRDHIFEAMSALFGEMSNEGLLDLLPPIDEARHLMLLPPRYRFQTDRTLCYHEYVMKSSEEFQQRESARKPVIEAALGMLRSAGLAKPQIGNYQSIIIAFLNIAENSAAGSPKRERMIQDTLSLHQQPYIDQALLHRLAELILTLRT
jgi:transcriptional regulator with XRE-family HTH domain